jgi:hypothetical protein
MYRYYKENILSFSLWNEKDLEDECNIWDYYTVVNYCPIFNNSRKDVAGTTMFLFEK